VGTPARGQTIVNIFPKLAVLLKVDQDSDSLSFVISDELNAFHSASLLLVSKADVPIFSIIRFR
jgi:hypothetical protein